MCQLNDKTHQFKYCLAENTMHSVQKSEKISKNSLNFSLKIQNFLKKVYNFLKRYVAEKSSKIHSGTVVHTYSGMYSAVHFCKRMAQTPANILAQYVGSVL